MGYRPADSGADTPTPVDFLETLTAQGPYMIIGKGGRKPSSMSRPYAPTEVYDYEFEAKLWIGIDRESNNDLENIETFVEAVVAAIENSTHSCAVGFDPPNIDTDRDPTVVLFTFKISVIGA